MALADQDRGRWDHRQIIEGLTLATSALGHGLVGEYRLQAAIAAVHAEAPTHAATDWSRIATLYGLLERLTRNPLVTLSRAVAVGETDGPAAGLEVLATVADRLAGHHRFLAVRAHLREGSGDTDGAVADLRAAAARATNSREHQHLTACAARLAGTATPTPDLRS